MQFRLLPLVGAAATVAFLGMARADDAKKTDSKPAAKKDECGGCCEGEKGAQKEVSSGKDASAKKDKDCGDCGDCDKGVSESTKAKLLSCDDCAKGSAVCNKCQAAIASGAVRILPISGMMCDGCEKKLDNKLAKLDAIAKVGAFSKKNVVAIAVAPGKTITLAEINKALEGTEFKVDETAALHGRVTFTVDGPHCDGCTKKVCDEVAKLPGADKCVDCSADAKTKTGTFTLALGDKSEVTIKSLREAVAASKFKLNDLVLTGAKDDKKS